MWSKPTGLAISLFSEEGEVLSVAHGLPKKPFASRSLMLALDRGACGRLRSFQSKDVRIEWGRNSADLLLVATLPKWSCLTLPQIWRVWDLVGGSSGKKQVGPAKSVLYAVFRIGRTAARFGKY